jgi:hypothetical protein
MDRRSRLENHKLLQDGMFENRNAGVKASWMGGLIREEKGLMG